MLKKSKWSLALIVLFSLSSAQAAKRVSPLVASLRLSDGSCLTGLLEPNSQEPVEAAGAQMVSWDQIRTVTLAENGEKAEITLGDGQVVRGRVVSEVVQLTSVVGRLSLPWTQITELKIDPIRRIPDSLTQNPIARCPIRFEVTLRDGSWLLGTPDSSGTRLHTKFGQIEVPWARLRHVSFHQDHETCTFELWNGDVLVGGVNWRAFTLATGLGPVHVFSEHAESITLSLGGLDLVEKPHESATGNRHFLSDMGNTRPKRILGRTYPTSQFICAHASGRIEYVLDEPVQEFHAFITMYESYCATKGNVIFKLETDDGLVYASRPIRNFQKEEVYVRFRPTRRLFLITDQNGSADEDWSVWLHPEVR